MLRLNQLTYLIALLFLPVFAYAGCKSKAVVKIKNSCPFTLKVNVDDKKTIKINPGDTQEVASISNDTVNFDDGIVVGNAKIKTSSSGNGTTKCKWHVEYTYYNGFDDPQGLNDGLDNFSKSNSNWLGVKQTGTWKFNLNMCQGGYKLKPTTIGLGRVNVEKNNTPDSDGYIILSGADDNNSYPMYDFNFTSTTTACHLKYDYSGNHYVLSCDQGNVKGFFMNDNKDLVFMCQQDASGHSKCPYITPRGSNNYQYNYKS
ncbi:hypothetical protein L3V83_07180 [Thiotrichales bacterium 19X7-9]|nr:hypothetical protein [Thiotrichales bacterium 19X7-9]